MVYNVTLSHELIGDSFRWSQQQCFVNAGIIKL